MSESKHQPLNAEAALIVGCGFLGKPLAQRLLANGQVVYGTTRSELRAKGLAGLGVRPLLLNVTQPLTYASLTPALEAASLDVYHMIPPGRIKGSPSARQIVLGGAAHMVKALGRADVRRAVMVSSSAVYGQTDGQRVDADTPAEPGNERAKLMMEGEKLWLDSGEPFHVLRLAGLYGPGRIIGLRAVRERAPIVGNPDAMLNLIHMDDAVTLLLAMMESDTAGRIELGSDGHPVPRFEYYAYLAKKLGVPDPELIDDQTASAKFGLDAQRLARSSNKSLDPTVTMQRTGWSAAVKDYRAGLDAIFPAGPSTPTLTIGRTC